MPLPLFGNRQQKSPAALVRSLRDSLVLLEKGDKKVERAVDDVTRWLSRVRAALWGTEDGDEPDSTVVEGLAVEVHNGGLIPLLFSQLPKLQFEARKDAALIFNNLLRRHSEISRFLVEHPEHLLGLIHVYENEDICAPCGLILRECIHQEELARILLYSKDMYDLFRLVQLPTFHVSSDAFLTLNELLTRHKTIVSQFLKENFENFFTAYNTLLMSDNYVTCRQSLKLLASVLLDRHNFDIMTKYVSSADNLKTVMEQLRNPSHQIQFEAFHVFKVFVANPGKPRAVLDILTRNREKLVKFLEDFLPERESDSQFSDEKAYILKQIHELHSPVV